MTVMEDVRATTAGLREVVPDLREALPDLRAALPELRESIPDARSALPALRQSLGELRADLPGPWRRERPSLVRRIAMVVIVALAVSATAWVVMAFVERRRIQTRSEPEGDVAALARAEDEGMGTAIGASSRSGVEPLATPQAPTTPDVGAVPVGSPLVGARSASPTGGASLDGEQTDGR
jgi:hypothetical protein